MNHTRKRGDELVDGYLNRVRQAGGRLSPARREELVEDLRAHLAAARAELAHETEAEVRTLLDRLGDPAEIVAEASVGEPPAAPAVVVPPQRSNRVLVTVLVILAVVVGLPVLVCVLGIAFLLPAGSHEPVGPNAPVEVSVSHRPAG